MFGRGGEGGEEFLKAKPTEATVGRLVKGMDGPCSLTTSPCGMEQDPAWPSHEENSPPLCPLPLTCWKALAF